MTIDPYRPPVADEAPSAVASSPVATALGLYIRILWWTVGIAVAVGIGAAISGMSDPQVATGVRHAIGAGFGALQVVALRRLEKALSSSLLALAVPATLVYAVVQGASVLIPAGLLESIGDLSWTAGATFLVLSLRSVMPRIRNRARLAIAALVASVLLGFGWKLMTPDPARFAGESAIQFLALGVLMLVVNLASLILYFVVLYAARRELTGSRAGSG